MSGDLRVTTAHVRELSAKQGQAAAELSAATEAVAGVDTAVRWTHGPISSATASAVQAAQHARRTAGTGMAGVSADLGDKLTAAATQYDRTDTSASGALDGTVR
ncbi:MAG TPA: ESX-1 secretion-associated protein [Mycobacterium sp.]|nr:ESX-1 secretion-associated protein [Mycobacterium sp.]